jgi:predicted glutamine amidotransferase
LFKSVEPAWNDRNLRELAGKVRSGVVFAHIRAATDGTTEWAFRYSSEGTSRSLCYSTKLSTVRELYPEPEAIQDLDEETRLIVSEPLRHLPGAWNEVPEASYGIVQPGQDELLSFTPAT